MNATAAEALHQLGTLYRDDEGNEVWMIRDREGRVQHEGIASDHDAAFLAEQLTSK